MANEVEIVVVGRDRTGNIFSQIRAKISESVRGASKDVDMEGRSIGSRLMSSIGGSLRKGAGTVTDAMNSVFSGSLKGALSTPMVGPIIIAALAAVAVAVGPVIASMISGALILGLGAGLVGLGAMVLLQNEKIKADFTKTFADIKGILTKAFEPLKPVLDVVRTTLKGLASDFAPFIKQAMELAKGPLIGFVKNLGRAFEQFKPALKPIMQAFSDILNTLGPALPGLFKSIANSIMEISKTVSENKTLIAALFASMLAIIPPVIDAIGGLTRFFGSMVSTAMAFAATMARAFVSTSDVVLTFIQNLLGGLRSVGQALGNVPGMEEFSRKMVAGLDQAIGKVGEWKVAAQQAGKAVELRANIVQLTQQLDKARAQLNNPDLTRERRAQINANIRDLMTKHAEAIRALGDPKLIKEYRSSLNSDISKLKARLSEARRELRNPELTKERRSKLNAEIGQLKSAVANAKAAIASVRGKTVTVFVKTEYQSDLSRAALRAASARAHGGIIGAAGGGPRSNMTLVGEQGPELVRLPFGSSVVSNSGTRSMFQRGDVGPGAQGGTTVNVYVQGSIRSDRDLVKLIRDEFVNGGFRGALNNA